MSDLRTLSPTTSLPWVFGALRVALGSWVGRRLMDEVLVLLLHRRLGVICGRLERMLVRFAAGRVMVRGARVGVVGSADAGPSEAVVSERVARRAAVRVWPLGFGWGLRLARLEVARLEMAGVGGHLRLVLAHPEMEGLLRASPAARRLLSPVCRMLGIEAAVLTPPGDGAVVVARVRAARVRTVKIPEERLPPLVWPRGVLAMVRKQKKLGIWRP